MATMEEILRSREKRVSIAESLSSLYKEIVVTFVLNIPGPEKNNLWIQEAFDYGLQDFLKFFSLSDIDLKKVLTENTGPEAFFIVRGENPMLFKRRLANFEDLHPIGRWFDIDLRDVNGNTFSRDQIGVKPRKCFICDKDAKECGRSRTHTASELFAVTQKNLKAYLKSRTI